MALQRSLLTSTYSDLTECNVFFVCIPTGIDENKLPELEPLKNVCKSLGEILKRGDIVILNQQYFPEQPKNYVYLFWKIFYDES